MFRLVLRSWGRVDLGRVDLGAEFVVGPSCLGAELTGAELVWCRVNRHPLQRRLLDTTTIYVPCYYKDENQFF